MTRNTKIVIGLAVAGGVAWWLSRPPVKGPGVPATGPGSYAQTSGDLAYFRSLGYIPGTANTGVASAENPASGGIGSGIELNLKAFWASLVPDFSDVGKTLKTIVKYGFLFLGLNLAIEGARLVRESGWFKKKG